MANWVSFDKNGTAYRVRPPSAFKRAYYSVRYSKPMGYPLFRYAFIAFIIIIIFKPVKGLFDKFIIKAK